MPPGLAAVDTQQPEPRVAQLQSNNPESDNSCAGAGLGFAGAAAAYSVSNIMECVLLLAIVVFNKVGGLLCAASIELCS